MKWDFKQIWRQRNLFLHKPGGITELDLRRRLSDPKSRSNRGVGRDVLLDVDAGDVSSDIDAKIYLK